jgi:cell division protein FtsB
MAKTVNNHADEKIVLELKLQVSRNDVLKAENEDLKRNNKKLKKAFVELLEEYQGELDRRDDTFHDRESVDYDWMDKAGLLD